MLDRLHDVIESLEGKVETLKLAQIKRIIELLEETQLSGEFVAHILVDEIKKRIVPVKMLSGLHPVQCNHCKTVMYECDVVEGAIYESQDVEDMVTIQES